MGVANLTVTDVADVIRLTAKAVHDQRGIDLSGHEVVMLTRRVFELALEEVLHGDAKPHD